MAAYLHRRTVLAGSASLALVASARASDTPTEPTPGLHDLLPDFWRFYDAGVGGETGERARGIDLQFVAPNVQAYTAAGFARDLPHGPITDSRLAEWLEAFDPLAAAARGLSQMFPDAWREHQHRFKSAFPAYRGDEPVYLLVSLFSFSGDPRQWRGRQCLFVGVDGLAQQEGGTPDLNVFLDHEVFSIYHLQANPALWPASKPPPLWVGLWREGLAGFVSAKLNPKAPPAEVLMSADLAAVSPQDLRPVAAQALAAMDTTDPGETRRFLDAGYEGDIPARSGYLLGLRLAERAGRSLSPDQLARLPAAKVHRFIKSELSQIAHG